MILLFPYTFIQLCHHISQISFVLQQIEFYEFPGGRRTTLFHTFCIFVNSEFCTYFHKSIFAYLFWYVNVIVNLIHLCFFWKIHFSTTGGPEWPIFDVLRGHCEKFNIGFFSQIFFSSHYTYGEVRKNFGAEIHCKIFHIRPIHAVYQTLTPFSDLSDLADMVPFWAGKHVFQWSSQIGISTIDNFTWS